VHPGGAFVQLSAGSNHVCARTSGQELYCWGSNSNGQLGDGTTTNRSTPVAVAGGHFFNMVSAGSEHTCGVVADLTGQPAYCWGWNPYGQLGDGTTTSRTVPTAVTGGHQFALVSAGGNGFTCGLLTSYVAAYCWGINNVGQLGNGTTNASLAPVMVAGGLTLHYLSAGFAHVVAVTDQLMGYAWGANNQGQLGDGTTTQRTTPVPIAAP
jgi:alpha-tubulin suppressor-like RCC1 family protein